MADEPQGSRTQANWTKLFSAFRVALDLKKLLLAAAGIVVSALGWWVFAAVFYTSSRPEWVDYQTTENKKEAWSRFKRDRERWNVLHEMAGPVPASAAAAVRVDAADLAGSLDVFEELNKIRAAHGRFVEPVVLKLDENAVVIGGAGGKALIINKEDVVLLKKLQGTALVLNQVVIADEPKQVVMIADTPVRIESDLKVLKAALLEGRSIGQIKADIERRPAVEKAVGLQAFEIYEAKLVHPAIRPVGKLRTWPWTEERGPNQYLLAEGLLRKDAEGHRTVPWEPGQFFSWLVSNQLPVLIEPLMKFLAPIGYFFNSAADGFRNRLYLFLVILWTVATWAFFGGAICRIAAVQIARNEKIGLRESILFAREKFLNLFTAPIFPLIFIGILTVFLIFIAWLIGFTVWFGDIVLAGPLFPIVLVLGLIMAVVLIGLIGWPLMNPTIAAEGSDNFDALSRSYSYVYQSIWQYLWYWAVALVYGAALIFFVGLVGSLVVYMGKWGMSQAPGLQSIDPANDRDPAYMFTYAPTSFGWRDLLIKDNPHVESKKVVTPSGLQVERYDFTPEYKAGITPVNRIAAAFVGLWVGLFFLLIVGFGYSFFWTASTLIYFLVRKQVDDTELDEVYFEEGDLEAPVPSVVAAPAPAPPVKPNTVSLNVVDPGTPPPAPLPESPAPTPGGDGAPPTPPPAL